MADFEHASDEVWTERRFGSQNARPFRSRSSDSAFQRDRARVIHSAAFRCLQGKTQILKLGEGDFYRTRLTHSLEVAQIASGIAEHLRDLYERSPAILSWIPSMSLIEAVGLAHDIGHPPFGHGGETALNYFLRSRGGFEGNGQTLRIAVRLGEYSPDCGLDLTRRALLGLLKYPALHREVARYDSLCDEGPVGTDTLNIDAWRPPKCVSDDDEKALLWILSPFTAADQEAFRKVVPSEGGHSRTVHASFDASIMELADDIAYGVHDFEDTLALRLVSFREWREATAAQLKALGEGELCENLEFYNRKLFSNDDRARKHAVSRLVYYFISNIELREEASFEAPLLRYRATMAEPAARELAFFKDFVFKYVIRSPAVQAMEFKGQQMLLRLFAALAENPKRLLPEDIIRRADRGECLHRTVADYLCGMTDDGASRLYLNLFSPNMGSFFNRF